MSSSTLVWCGYGWRSWRLMRPDSIQADMRHGGGRVDGHSYNRGHGRTWGGRVVNRGGGGRRWDPLLHALECAARALRAIDGCRGHRGLPGLAGALGLALRGRGRAHDDSVPSAWCASGAPPFDGSRYRPPSMTRPGHSFTGTQAPTCRAVHPGRVVTYPQRRHSTFRTWPPAPKAPTTSMRR